MDKQIRDPKQLIRPEDKNDKIKASEGNILPTGSREGSMMVHLSLSFWDFKRLEFSCGEESNREN